MKGHTKPNEQARGLENIYMSSLTHFQPSAVTSETADVINDANQGIRRRAKTVSVSSHADLATQTTPVADDQRLAPVTVPLPANIYSWFIVSKSSECNGILVRAAVGGFILLQVTALWILYHDLQLRAEAHSQSTTLSLEKASTTTGIIARESGKSVVLDTFHEPDGSIVTTLLQLVVPPLRRPSRHVLYIARFVGHMFLVLRVLPTMLDVSRAVVTWGLSLNSRGFSETANVFIRTAAFLSTILLTVGMLFIVSTAMMMQAKTLNELLRAGLSIVFIFEAHKNVFELLTRYLHVPPKFEVKLSRREFEFISPRCDAVEKYVMLIGLCFPFIEVVYILWEFATNVVGL